MKHFTRSMLLAAALGTAAYTQAQVFSFDAAKADFFAPVHRNIPAIGDYNNDGLPDIYYGGQGFSKGDSKWSWDIMVDIKDEEGNVIGQEPGRQDLGWWTVGYLFTGSGAGAWTYSASYGPLIEQGGEFGANGLPPSTYGYARWFDYNNDGMLDFYTSGKNEYGWSIEGAPDGFYSLLYKNEGGKFSHETLAQLPCGDNEKGNPQRNNSSMSFGDYNNDGYTDILIQCMKKWNEDGETKSARSVELYKNNGDGTFELQKVFNPIAYEENKHPDGLFNMNEDTFEAIPTLAAKPMTHGAAMFGDLNNDGWLDIISSGYSNDGVVIYIYKNNGDGTFQELNLEDKGFVGVYESELALADVNNDGWLDIISSGTDDTPNSTKRADIYLNKCDGNFNFDLSTAANGNGLYGEAEACMRVVDLNHDGLVDIISSGWSHVNSGWSTRVFYQNFDGTFTHQQDLRHFDSGAWEIADLNGDGAIDLIGGGYGKRYDDYDETAFADYYAGQETENIETPEAPSNVTAVNTDGKITVKWDGTGDAGNSYNVYIKNVETGWIAQIVPADTETGKLKVFHNLQTTLRSDNAEGMTYTITVPTNGKYEVGVQTVKNDWQTSGFTKATLNVIDGIQTMEKTQDGNVKETIYTLSGTQVNNGMHGVFIVKKGNKVIKVVK